MSTRITSKLPADVALSELREQLDEYMRTWHTTNIEKTKLYADGYTDGVAHAASLLAGTTAFDELCASERRTDRGSK